MKKALLMRSGSSLSTPLLLPFGQLLFFHSHVSFLYLFFVAANADEINLLRRSNK